AFLKTMFSRDTAMVPAHARNETTRSMGQFVCCVLMTLSALTATSAAMSQEAGSIRRDRIAGLADFVDGVLAQQIAQEEVVGAVMAVVADGNPLFSRGYGFADIERKIPVDANRTLFRVASVTKLFTFAALMQLVDAGRIDLDAP